jgi:hypothetical protein
MKDGDRQQRSNAFAQTHSMLLIVVLMAALRVGAQTSTTGDIAGVVTDPTAAVVSGAPVTLKNVDTGSSTSTTTNTQGSYNFSLLQPGNYSVSANVAGFQKVLKTVTVTLGTSITVNLQLSLSSQVESVDVTDEVTGVQTFSRRASEGGDLDFRGRLLFVSPRSGNSTIALHPSAFAKTSQTIFSYSGISRDRPSCICRGKTRTRKKQEPERKSKSDSCVVGLRCSKS